jgi:hypothetical protein
MARKLICVRGIPGAGKTHMARELARLGVACVDTDDVVSATYADMARAGSTFSVDDVYEQAQRRMRVVCLERGQGVTVVVGATLTVERPDETLFIAMSPKQLALAYERTVKRELKKYAGISPQAIGKLRTWQIAPYLACKLHVNAFAPTRPFEEYEGVYASALEFERNNGAVAMSPREILSYVRKCAARAKRAAKTAFGTAVSVTRKDDTTIEVEQGSAAVNFGSARLYTYNLVNCIAIGGSFKGGTGGAFLTHESPTEFGDHQSTLRSVARTIKDAGARVDEVVLFCSKVPSVSVYAGNMTVPKIVELMRSFCAETFDAPVSVERYEQAESPSVLSLAGFFVGSATVWPGGHTVGKAAFRPEAVVRRQVSYIDEDWKFSRPKRAPTGTFVVGVATDKDGDKVYVCPACDRRTGTYAVQHADDPDAFGHFHGCPNDGKVPVELANAG